MMILNRIKSVFSLTALITSIVVPLLIAMNCAKPAVNNDATKQSGYVFTDTWVTQVPESNETTAAYFTLANETGVDDVLLGAVSDIAEFIEIHEMIQDKDVTGMKMLDQVEVKTNDSVQFSPGGLHLMLIGLTSPVKKGSPITITLKFQNAGDVKVNFEVKAPHEYFEGE